MLSFGSTKGKKVQSNFESFGVVVPQRKFDQYLNKSKKPILPQD